MGPPPQTRISFCGSKVWGTTGVRISKKNGQDLSSCTVHLYGAGVERTHQPHAWKPDHGLTLYPEWRARVKRLRGSLGATSVGGWLWAGKARFQKTCL
jgi:hypothetical protein